MCKGSKEFIEFLDSELDSSLEIYIRPFLNGDEPDICILNPKKGLSIFNIIDWDDDNYFYKTSRKSIKPRGSQYSRYINVKKYYRKNKDDGVVEVSDPTLHVRGIKKNIYSLYVPELAFFLKKGVNKNISTGLFLPKIDTAQARSLFPINLNKCQIIGNDYRRIDINQIVKYLNEDRIWSEWKSEWNQKIRHFLVPPIHKIEDGIFIKLSNEQKNHVQHSPNKHQRLRGVAGSGKTLVIAQRAANIASSNKNVLIITFNITLIHYILEQVNRAQYNYHWKNITIKHFHGFCSEYLKENSIPWPNSGDYDREDDENKLDSIIPQLVRKSILNGVNNRFRKYDAIIIDEGQDFLPLWLQALMPLLSNNNEIFLVCDENQNVYKRKQNWTDFTGLGTNFNKRWRELKTSYRFPPKLAEYANLFVTEFLPSNEIPLISDVHELSFFNHHFMWVNISENVDIREYVFKTLKFLHSEENMHLEDIVVLVYTHDEGIRVADYLKARKVKVNDVFARNGSSKEKKLAFKITDIGLKMSTINSFKGWELLTTILITPDVKKIDDTQKHYLTYTGITRTRSNLIVINRSDVYRKFGSTWPKSWKESYE